MSKVETPASNVRIEDANSNLRILRDDELDLVSGGAILEQDGFVSNGYGGMLGNIVSPRDAASGLPTGKRAARAFNIT
jgi:hypothetical protein